MSDTSQSAGDRRALLVTGAAALAGGVVLGSQGEAEAANGDSMKLGLSNTASATTKLTKSGNTAAFSASNTSTGSAAHGLVATVKGGYGLIATSTAHHGGTVYTSSPAKYGLVVQNTSTSSGEGVALLARHQSSGTGAGGATAIRGAQGPGSEAALTNTSPIIWPAAAEFAGGVGVVGMSIQNGGLGVAGVCHKPSGFGLVGACDDASGYAIYGLGRGQISGNWNVGGTLTKSGGSFKIDHPLDPANKYLSHSFVESPDMMNVYNGVVETDAHGKATVDLPDWFESLNKDFRYQLTPIGSSAPELHVSKEVSGNKFSVAGGRARQRVSWQVTGVRRDTWANHNRIPVEEAKPRAERGTYLYPEGFGKPASSGVHAGQNGALRLPE